MGKKEEVDSCVGCKLACFEKVEGVLVPRKCYSRKFYQNAYKELLVGSKPSKEIAQAAAELDVDRNSLIYYPHQAGATRIAAMMLLKMQVSVFRQIHTHYLIDVYVSNSEEEKSLREMYSPFFLMFHGIIPTPNRRLTDLILEFLSYKMSDGVPFLLFTVTKPEPPIEQFFRENDLNVYEIRTRKERDQSVF